MSLLRRTSARLAHFARAWHQLEMLTDIRAGTLKMVGGWHAPSANYAASITAHCLSVFKVQSTFGGPADRSADQYFWFDTSHISGSDRSRCLSICIFA